MLSTLMSQDTAKWKSFAAEIDSIDKDLRSTDGVEDFKQLRKMEFWGRCCSLLGYLTAWILPNPISALLISQGNFTRWSLVLHPISHGAFDKSAHVPEKYKSTLFGKSSRRFLDWFDWITPNNWNDEHNKLHHYHLGSDKDPDVVLRNTSFIRELKLPPLLRYVVAFLLASAWKPVYYAVNTLAESRHQRGLLATNRISWNNWSLFTPEGRELWFVCLLPYALYRFVLLPLLFLPLGKTAVISVLLNSVLAEILTNLHSFMMIAPNHTGEDIYNFSGLPKGKPEYYLRQIMGTVNYPAGNDFFDFIHGGMNYQIEHHLWPEASILQYRRLRPRLQEICARYGVPYVEENVLSRLLKTIKIIAGSTAQTELNLSVESL